MTEEVIYRPERPAPNVEQLQEEIRRLALLLNRIQVSAPSKKLKILFLDFDGPLAIPWALNENPWPQIPGLLRKVSARPDVLLCLVSFNPGAEAAVARWGVRDCFTAVRAGCNRKLEKGEEYTETHRKGLSKAEQIRSILTELPSRVEYEAAIFDDDAKNLFDVYEQFGGGIRCFYVPESLTQELLSSFIG